MERTAHVANVRGLLGKPDVDFHIAIADATHNAVMAHVVNSLRAMFQTVLRVRYITRNPARTQLLVAQHQRILETIRRQDGPEASAAMVALLELIENEIRGFEAKASGQAGVESRQRGGRALRVQRRRDFPFPPRPRTRA